MKITKRIACILLAVILTMTAFMVTGNTAEAKEKNTEYSCYINDIKTFKKLHGKLTVKVKKSALLGYVPDGAIRAYGTRKITYKIAKGCKWRFFDNDRKWKKASYKAIKQHIKWKASGNRLSIKIKNGKVVKVVVYRYYG